MTHTLYFYRGKLYRYNYRYCSIAQTYSVDQNTNMLVKDLSVGWCDCLTQSSWWVLFNGNWQQLNSLAPFGRPLLLVLFSPPNSGPTSKFKPSPLCYMSDLLLSTVIKKYFPPLLRKGKYFQSSPHRLYARKQNYLPCGCACVYLSKVLKYQPFHSVRQERVSTPRPQFNHSSALKSLY